MNFKIYYSNGGDKIAKNIITCAENNLGNIENFLGTRLVEKIDIFLFESSEYDNSEIYQRNGTIILTNSEIKIFYKGNILEAYYQLKKQLAEILIYNMLFGNTIKDRLKNNREVNIQDWFVKGLGLFVAQKKETNSGIMADYFENRINLNFNLLTENETEEIGFSIVKFLNDTFGSTKLKQILFYTRLAGNTDFAFKVVLNKSSDKIISKWFITEKELYFKNSKLRLPNEPEKLSSKLKNSNISDMKFNSDGQSLDLLIKTEYGVEIYNYNFEKRISKRLFKLNTIKSDLIFNFCYNGELYILSISNGYSSKIYYIYNRKIIKNINSFLPNIYKISNYKDGILILAQINFKTDLYFFKIKDENNLINLTNGNIDITDYAVNNSTAEIYVSGILNDKYCITNLSSKKTVFSSNNIISELNPYKDNMLSFLSFSNGINAGMILDPGDTSKFYRVTNYNRSINIYDYSPKIQMVAELINYDKKNYIVISDATIKEKYSLNKDSANINRDSIKTAENLIEGKDTIKYFITGFEYRKDEISSKNKTIHNKVSLPIKLKEFKIDKNEFKPWFMKIAFSNETIHNKEFAYFFPIDQGLNNGANIVLGCGIIEIFKKYKFVGNVRQPLKNKGIDLDFFAVRNEKNGFSGMKFYFNNFQRELYNSTEKFSTIELKYLTNHRFNHKIIYSFETGLRHDSKIYTSINEANIIRNDINIVQPFALYFINYEIFKNNRLNYNNALNIETYIKINKPMKGSGFNNVFKLKISNNQIIYRILKVSIQAIISTSPSKQKTVFLMGGQSNWLKPVYGISNMHDSSHTLFYSPTEDFEGFPLNYLSGTSYNINKLKLVLPLNPVLSFNSFNQNIFKYLCVKAIFNIGTIWYGKNPFSITNPENRSVTETGSMTIINYTYKNPLLWSWCTGINSVVLGYNFGVDYSMGYNERGNTGKFICFTIGKEI